MLTETVLAVEVAEVPAASKALAQKVWVPDDGVVYEAVAVTLVPLVATVAIGADELSQ